MYEIDDDVHYLHYNLHGDEEGWGTDNAAEGIILASCIGAAFIIGALIKFFNAKNKEDKS